MPRIPFEPVSDYLWRGTQDETAKGRIVPVCMGHNAVGEPEISVYATHDRLLARAYACFKRLAPSIGTNSLERGGRHVPIVILAPPVDDSGLDVFAVAREQVGSVEQFSYNGFQGIFDQKALAPSGRPWQGACPAEWTSLTDVSVLDVETITAQRAIEAGVQVFTVNVEKVDPNKVLKKVEAWQAGNAKKPPFFLDGTIKTILEGIRENRFSDLIKDGFLTWENDRPEFLDSARPQAMLRLLGRGATMGASSIGGCPTRPFGLQASGVVADLCR